jgi:CRP/FNR family transcriptional regulator, cyclic AMP receptor protein
MAQKMAQKKEAPLDVRMYLAKARGGTTKDYRKKTTVFSQGSPADAVFYIEKGKVKLTVLSTRGKEAVVAILGSGDFFGEGCLAGQPLRMATATAMTAAASHGHGDRDDRVLDPSSSKSNNGPDAPQ